MNTLLLQFVSLLLLPAILLQPLAGQLLSADQAASPSFQSQRLTEEAIPAHIVMSFQKSGDRVAAGLDQQAARNKFSFSASGVLGAGLALTAFFFSILGSSAAQRPKHSHPHRPASVTAVAHGSKRPSRLSQPHPTATPINRSPVQGHTSRQPFSRHVVTTSPTARPPHPSVESPSKPHQANPQSHREKKETGLSWSLLLAGFLGGGIGIALFGLISHMIPGFLRRIDGEGQTVQERQNLRASIDHLLEKTNPSPASHRQVATLLPIVSAALLGGLLFFAPGIPEHYPTVALRLLVGTAAAFLMRAITALRLPPEAASHVILQSWTEVLSEWTTLEESGQDGTSETVPMPPVRALRGLLRQLKTDFLIPTVYSEKEIGGNLGSHTISLYHMVKDLAALTTRSLLQASQRDGIPASQRDILVELAVEFSHLHDYAIDYLGTLGYTQILASYRSHRRHHERVQAAILFVEWLHKFTFRAIADVIWALHGLPRAAASMVEHGNHIIPDLFPARESQGPNSLVRRTVRLLRQETIESESNIVSAVLGLGVLVFVMMFSDVAKHAVELFVLLGWLPFIVAVIEQHFLTREKTRLHQWTMRFPGFENHWHASMDERAHQVHYRQLLQERLAGLAHERAMAQGSCQVIVILHRPGEEEAIRQDLEGKKSWLYRKDLEFVLIPDNGLGSGWGVARAIAELRKRKGKEALEQMRFGIVRAGVPLGNQCAFLCPLPIRAPGHPSDFLTMGDLAISQVMQLTQQMAQENQPVPGFVTVPCYRFYLGSADLQGDATIVTSLASKQKISRQGLPLIIPEVGTSQVQYLLNQFHWTMPEILALYRDRHINLDSPLHDNEEVHFFPAGTGTVAMRGRNPESYADALESLAQLSWRLERMPAAKRDVLDFTHHVLIPWVRSASGKSIWTYYGAVLGIHPSRTRRAFYAAVFEKLESLIPPNFQFHLALPHGQDYLTDVREEFDRANLGKMIRYWMTGENPAARLEADRWEGPEGQAKTALARIRAVAA